MVVVLVELVVVVLVELLVELLVLLVVLVVVVVVGSPQKHKRRTSGLWSRDSVDWQSPIALLEKRHTGCPSPVSRVS